jgi:RimJ/RimL family protein N-acetyltransferase
MSSRLARHPDTLFGGISHAALSPMSLAAQGRFEALGMTNTLVNGLGYFDPPTPLMYNALSRQSALHPAGGHLSVDDEVRFDRVALLAIHDVFPLPTHAFPWIGANGGRRVTDAPRLHQHDVTLCGQTPGGTAVCLRPLTEAHWPFLYRWYSDPEVLYYSEEDDVDAYSPEDVRGIYCQVSPTAFCFIIEADGVPVGDGWLQQMNYNHVLERYPNRDVRRIDLAIGEKDHWGRGIGTETIRLLTGFAFEEQGADLVYNVEIGDHNPRSWKAFRRVGYEIVDTVSLPPGSKGKYGYDLALTREQYLESRGASIPDA